MLGDKRNDGVFDTSNKQIVENTNQISITEVEKRAEDMISTKSVQENSKELRNNFV